MTIVWQSFALGGLTCLILEFVVAFIVAIVSHFIGYHPTPKP